MNPVKKFFIKLGVVYLVICAVLIGLFGSPDLSGSYMSEYKKDHEHYIGIIKSEEYKAYRERPVLVETDEAFEDRLAYVDEYEAREDFQKARKSADRYVLGFEFLNALTVIAIIARFAPKPLSELLDKKIEDIRTHMDVAEEKRETAGARKSKAKARMDGLEGEKKCLEDEGEKSRTRILAAIEEETVEDLKMLDEEMEGHKQEELHRAALKLRRELLAASMDTLMEECKATVNPEREARLFDEFIVELEKRG